MHQHVSLANTSYRSPRTDCSGLHSSLCLQVLATVACNANRSSFKRGAQAVPLQVSTCMCCHQCLQVLCSQLAVRMHATRYAGSASQLRTLMQVDFRERQYTVGKVPTTWNRSEGPPGQQEVLTSHTIEQALRPLFPPDFTFDVQVCPVVAIL